MSYEDFHPIMHATTAATCLHLIEILKEQDPERTQTARKIINSELLRIENGSTPLEKRKKEGSGMIRQGLIDGVVFLLFTGCLCGWILFLGALTA